MRDASSVYPRWRGEHRYAFAVFIKHFGLSPLARGTPHCSMIAAEMSRFIPAGAGNTTGNGSTASGDAVYPRWRGEHE
ncbi:CRISPR associated protein [Salmonella enterica subsp. enterica serovar Cerro]|nr:CRISPR associated protein of unknown function [Salmonella enterica subsp. enterica serovar Cerro]KMN26714.1 CRISPR associated protein [Salmonella enterica subsp. enterica serovar Cerro]